MTVQYNTELIAKGDNHALIDADCVAYWGAAGCNELSLRVATRRVDMRMKQILYECNAEGYTGYLTGKNNFRDDIATLQRYKGNRYDKLGKRILEQPIWLKECRQYLIDEWDCIVTEGQEADDALSIHRAKYLDSDKLIISSIDKDLRINPGLQHNMNSGIVDRVLNSMTPMEVIAKVSPTTGKKSNKVEGQGLMFFYAQLLMGDAADWIKGLPKVTDAMKDEWPSMRRGGCGAMTAVHVLKGVTTLEEAHDRVWFCYKSYWKDHEYYHWNDDKKVFKAGLATARKQFIEQGRLLWMRREEGELWEPNYSLN